MTGCRAQKLAVISHRCGACSANHAPAITQSGLLVGRLFPGKVGPPGRRTRERHSLSDTRSRPGSTGFSFHPRLCRRKVG